jgi:hypothetical protein
MCGPCHGSYKAPSTIHLLNNFMVVWLFTQAAQEHIVRNHVWQDDQEADKWVEAIAHNVELFKIQKDPRCAADVSRHTYSLLVGLPVCSPHACMSRHARRFEACMARLCHLSQQIFWAVFVGASATKAHLISVYWCAETWWSVALQAPSTSMKYM